MTTTHPGVVEVARRDRDVGVRGALPHVRGPEVAAVGGRADVVAELVLRDGVAVAVAEVDQPLHRHPFVDLAGLVGDDRGRRVVAAVELDVQGPVGAQQAITHGQREAQRRRRLQRLDRRVERHERVRAAHAGDVERAVARGTRHVVDGAADVGIAAGRAADDAVGQAGVVDVIADKRAALRHEGVVAGGVGVGGRGERCERRRVVDGNDINGQLVEVAEAAIAVEHQELDVARALDRILDVGVAVGDLPRQHRLPPRASRPRW